MHVAQNKQKAFQESKIAESRDQEIYDNINPEKNLWGKRWRVLAAMINNNQGIRVALRNQY